MKKLYLVLFTIIPIYVFPQFDANFEKKLFEVYEPGANNRTLMNINGDKLVTYSRDKCKIEGEYAIVDLFGKSFLYDSNGELLSYDKINFLSNDRFVVVSEGNYGIVDKSGNIIVPIIYDFIHPELLNKKLVVVVKHNKLGLLDVNSNKVVIPMDYDTTITVDDFEMMGTRYGGYRLKKNGKWGIVDINNKIIVPFKYDGLFGSGDGFIQDNEIFVVPSADETWKPQGLAYIKNNEKWGLINIKTGKETMPCIYDRLRYYDKNIIKVTKNGKSGIINSKGDVVVPFEYDALWSFYNTDYIASKKTPEGREIYTLFDYQGKKRLSGIEGYKSLPYFDYYILKRNGKWEVKDIRTLNTLSNINEDLDNRWPAGFRRHFLVTYDKNNFAAILDIKRRKLITDFSYTEIQFSHCATYAYCETPNHSHNCIINLKDGTKKYLPSGYDVDGFQDERGLFEVGYKKDDGTYNYGVINKKGDIVLPAEYSGERWTVIHFEGDFIIVKNIGIFDKNGVLLLPGNYSGIYSRDIEFGGNGDLMEVTQYDSNRNVSLHGYYKYDGGKLKELLPCIYSKGEAFYQLYVHIHENSKPDVDINIPVDFHKSEQTFAVIIANEKYTETSIPNVPYAKNDGSVFKEYCQKTLGIPSSNIKFRENATLNQIRYELDWLKDAVEAYNGDAKIIFYYAGHGIPDERNSSSYLLPSDGFGSDINSAYSINELYSQLGELRVKQITVFMDACFSGAKRDGDMLASARGVAIKAKSGTPKGNMVVFSAAQGDETAHQYNKKKHGMFTYFLLKKLQETKGEATLEELATYIKEQVKKYSITENGKLQTPTMQLSPEFQISLKEITL